MSVTATSYGELEGFGLERRSLVAGLALIVRPITGCQFHRKWSPSYVLLAPDVRGSLRLEHADRRIDTDLHVDFAELSFLRAEVRPLSRCYPRLAADTLAPFRGARRRSPRHNGWIWWQDGVSAQRRSDRPAVAPDRLIISGLAQSRAYCIADEYIYIDKRLRENSMI